MQRSDDGGRTWSAAVTLRTPVTGVIPVVRPDGTLVLPFWSERTGMLAVVSQDGGVTLGTPDPDLASSAPSDVRPLRGPPLIAADVDPAGRVLVVWQDCRFRERVRRRTTSSSPTRPTARTWSEPVRVTRGRNVAIPTIGIEPVTGRLAIAYYVIRSGGSRRRARHVGERRRALDGPQRLTPRTMPLDWMPDTTLGRMLADYIGVSWSRGRPLVVYALASPPSNGKLRPGDLRRARLSAEAKLLTAVLGAPATGPIGCQTVLSSRKLAIAHGLCSSARAVDDALHVVGGEALELGRRGRRRRSGRARSRPCGRRGSARARRGSR